MKRYLLIAMVSALALTAGCAKNNQVRVTQQRMAKPATTEEVTEEISEEPVTESSLYIITDIDLEGKTIGLMDVNSGRQRTYRYDTSTKFYDKYGDKKSIASFEKGYPVTAVANTDVAGLSRMQISDDAFIYDDVVKFKIDQTNNTISIAGDDFYYNNVLGCYCDDSRIMLSSIKNGDELRIVGLDKRILSVVVTSGHGSLKLENTSLFDGSVMCVGLEVLTEVKPGMRLELPEGKYMVTVANDGWGSSRDIIIERNKELILDLDTMKGEGPKFCKLSFDLKGIEEAKIEIDGEEIDFSEAHDIRYGTHDLKITADGYEPVEKSLVVNSEEATIELELTLDGTVPATSDDNDDSGDGETNSDGTGTGNSNLSQQDYLTTLYNLLTALTNAQNSQN